MPSISIPTFGFEAEPVSGGPLTSGPLGPNPGDTYDFDMWWTTYGYNHNDYTKSPPFSGSTNIPTYTVVIDKAFNHWDLDYK